MNVYDFTLKSNGLKIVYIEKKESQVVAMNLIGKCGSIYEDIPGTAHFLEHLALDGSQKYPLKRDLLSLVLNSGGSVNATTSKNFTEFTVKVIASELENGLELLSQAVFYPKLGETSIEKERKIILEEYKRAIANDQRQLFETLIGLTYKDNSMNRMVLGDDKSLKVISKETVEKFWKRYYHPNNFVLSICGDFDKDKLFKMIETYFENVPKGDVFEDKTFSQHDKKNLKILKRENAAQAKLMIGYSSPSRNSNDYYSSLLLSSILGKGISSRLFLSLREGKQLVYDISSLIWHGPNRGLMYTQCGTDEKNINEVIRTIISEQNKLMTEDIAEEEINLHKKRIRSASLFELEDSVLLASHYAHFRITLENLVSLEEEIEKIDEVTSAQVKNTAIKIFSNKPHLAIIAKNISEKQINFN